MLWRCCCKPFRVNVRANPVAHIRYCGQKDGQCPEEHCCVSFRHPGWGLEAQVGNLQDMKLPALHTHGFYSLQSRGLRSRELRASAPAPFLYRELYLQRFQRVGTLGNILGPTQVSSLLSPKAVGCHTLNLPLDLPHTLHMLSPRRCHPWVSSEEETVLPYLVSIEAR